MRLLRLACPSQIQRVLPEITIPDCMEGVTASIVDSSCKFIVSPDQYCLKGLDLTRTSDSFTARLADRAHLDVELRKAHVIVIVYSIDQPSSFDRLSAWWLPYIRQQGVNVSVLVVVLRPHSEISEC